MNMKTIKTKFRRGAHHVGEPTGAWELTVLWLAVLGFFLAMAVLVFFLFLR
jgi:hypothetical protein